MRLLRAGWWRFESDVRGLLTIGSARLGLEVRMMACMKGVVFCVIRGIIEALSRE